MRATILACVVACVVSALAGCAKKAAQAPGLVILSPSSENIRNEFDRSFKGWYKAKFGQDIHVEWRDVGGSGACAKFLLNTYELASTSGIDLYFGGGGPDHVRLAEKGIDVAIDLPAEILAQIPPSIGGVMQVDPRHRWHATAVSCFGIIYNAKLLGEKGIPIPQKWDDLTGKAYYGWLEAASPISGSARAAYEMIIQSEKQWPDGWAKLLKIYANCKTFPDSAGEITSGVANGDILAGAAIDFYAFDQIAKSGPSIGFTAVKGSTAFTPDPIALLKGAPHPEAAGRFIQFVLSSQGQALWCLPPGAEGGPTGHALYRQPVRKDMYEKYKGKMLPGLVDPFEVSGDYHHNEAVAGVRIGRLIGPLMKAAAMDSPDQLHKAWKAILDAGSPPAAVAKFVALPDDLATEAIMLETAKKLSDEKTAMAVTDAWQRFFRDKYDTIIREGGK